MSIQSQLYQKIFDCIHVKAIRLRLLQQFLPEENFICFIQHLEEFEIFLDESREYQGALHIPSLNFLEKDKNCCLQALAKKQFALNQLESEEQALEFVLHDIEKAEERFNFFFVSTFEEINFLINDRLRCISQIGEAQAALKELLFLRSVVLNNFKNSRFILDQINVRSFWELNLAKLARATCDEFKNLTQLLTILTGVDMDSPRESTRPSEASSSRSHFSKEFNELEKTTEVPSGELETLRREMFPDPEPSLSVQQEVIKDRAESTEVFLRHRLVSIDALQDTIKQTEFEVARLVEESERARDVLRRKRAAFREGIVELLHLLKLIEQIEREISAGTADFQQNMADMEKRRLEILNDPNLTEEERRELLQQLDAEMQTTKDKYAQKLRNLAVKRESLRRESRDRARNLQMVDEDLERAHQQEIEELERLMRDASPSEQLRLEAEIKRLKQQHAEQMAAIDQAAHQREYFFDEHGRYYINVDGVKVYKRDSYAAEFIINENGEWVQVGEAVERQIDERGEYYIDQFGRKIYTKQFFTDEDGRRFFIDSNGRRVFIQEDDDGLYYIDEFGRKIYEKRYMTDEYGRKYFQDGEGNLIFVETGERSETEASVEVSLSELSNADYIKRVLGRPLTLGLARAAQQADPINFLANFLLQYRLHENQTQERNRELGELLEKRELIRNMESKDSADCGTGRIESKFE